MAITCKINSEYLVDNSTILNMCTAQVAQLQSENHNNSIATVHIYLNTTYNIA